MTRCIHCTRCVRFSEEIAGIKLLGTLNRGQKTEIGTYVSSILKSNISGNVIDLCPVGALTSRLYAFKARPWELKTVESIDLTDSSGSNIFIAVKQTNIVRITPKKNIAINNIFISDKARFAFDAVTNLRLLENFWKKTTWNSLNLQFLFTSLKLELQKKFNIFLIPEDLDYQNLINLASLERISNNKIKFCSVVPSLSKQNLYMHSNCSTILNFEKNFKLCYLLSSNVKIENIILNIKIRTKYLKSQVSIFSSGFSFSTNFPNSFVTLNPTLLLQIFESKTFLALQFIKELKAWFILGHSLNTRFFSSELVSFFKNLFPKTNFLNLKKAANSESIDFLNIKSINTNFLKKGSNLFAWSLEDNLLLHKILFSFPNKKFWVNSHSPLLAKKSDFLIPTLTSFEKDGIFINFEGKSQKAYKSILNVNKNIINFEYLFIVFRNFYTNNKYKNKSAFLFFIEMSKKFVSFEKTQFFFSSNFFTNSLEFFWKYPLKTSFEDFYQTDAFTKNSLNMFKRSKEIRKLSTNFFKNN